MATPVSLSTSCILVDTTVIQKVFFLPAVSTIPSGQLFIVKDSGNNASKSTIFLSTIGLDTFDYRTRNTFKNGCISTNNGSVMLCPDGRFNWMVLQFYNTNNVV
jgi:hypothetical protein